MHVALLGWQGGGGHLRDLVRADARPAPGRLDLGDLRRSPPGSADEAAVDLRYRRGRGLRRRDRSVLSLRPLLLYDATGTQPAPALLRNLESRPCAQGEQRPCSVFGPTEGPSTPGSGANSMLRWVRHELLQNTPYRVHRERHDECQKHLASLI